MMPACGHITTVSEETRIWIHVYFVCRDTEKEAKDYLRYYVYDKGDWEAASNLLRIFGVQSASYDPKTLEDHKAHFIAGHGGYPLVGTPLQIADELGRLSDIGVDGCLISWVDYMDELKQWNAEVLPLLVQSGLRQPVRCCSAVKDSCQRAGCCREPCRQCVEFCRECET